MFARHLCWLALKLFGSILSLNLNYLRSFVRAIGKLSKVRVRRRIEKNAATISDSALEQKFVEIVKQPGIHVVANETDEKAFAAMQAASSVGANAVQRSN
jgi:hypothetical protein